ncbi:PocR ligand-binding domain-containing protein [Pseudodesulfovibrio sp.]|uniref:PocR ligand-binding domain-containing protein n=1 Tax=unclassified Pseudodesulfovibrio TaxID=2661612 RepID=UPI003B00CBF5
MSRPELEKRIAALRAELAAAEAELSRTVPTSRDPLTFEDIFDIDEIQTIQDAFANATGLGSLITTPDGRAITKPSNFCSLCRDIIRKTEKGQANCVKSDVTLGRRCTSGPVIQPCLSSGLLDGGVNITVDGRHIANWYVGQVRNEGVDEERIRAYARELGADEESFRKAYEDVSIMSTEQFRDVCQTLYIIANTLSLSAYRNRQLTEKIVEAESSAAEVQRLKSFLSNIVDSMPSILVGVDPEGRVTHWNMRAASATGLKRDEVEGRQLCDVLPELAEQMDKVTRAIQERRPMRAEKVLRERQGEQRYQDVSVYPLVANGVQGAVIRVDDITERVRIEEMMIQSEKMLSVGGLAAGMAHEINNPLAAILGNARLLQKRLLEPSPRNKHTAEALGLGLQTIFDYMGARSVDSMLQAIIESGERAGRVVTNMLDFSRKSDGTRGKLDPAMVLDRAVELVKNGHNLSHSYNFKDIIFEREYEDGEFFVHADAGQLEQVFFNILNNGAQAMTETHRESGRTPTFILRRFWTEGVIRVEIADNGPGMTDAVRRRVFEPFFTTKEPGVGTGLGMSVAYFIVSEGHGGNMRVVSHAGKGARFIIDLPSAG